MNKSVWVCEQVERIHWKNPTQKNDFVRELDIATSLINGVLPQKVMNSEYIK